jgi:diamine N-acetyltransferase
VTEETGSSRAPATDGPSVRLLEITDANRAAVEAVRILPGQEEYGDTVVEALEEAARSPENRPWWRAVYVGDTPVGFVMLSLDAPPGDERSPFRFFLWKLLIDARFQRRGYGTATIDAVVDLLRDYPGADALFTSAVSGPASPASFYEHYGFVRTGEIFDDEIVLRLDLHTGASPPVT